MGGAVLKFKIVEHAHVAKYAEGVTQEQIDAGTAEPYEIVEGTREREVTADEVRARGLNPEALMRAHLKQKEEI